MKILTAGKSWTNKKTCKGCGAVLIIEREDISYSLTNADISAQQYEEEIEGTFYVHCPSCGQYIPFRKHDIPEIIKTQIKQENK